MGRLTTLSCLYIEYVARVGTCSVDMSIKTKNRGKRFSWLGPKVRKSLFPAKEIVWHKLPVKHQIIVVTVLEGRSLLSVALYLLHWHEGFIFSFNSAGKPLSAFCCKISDFPFNIIMIADWTLLLNTHCFLRLHTASAPKLSKVWTWITLTARFSWTRTHSQWSRH